MTVEAHEQLKRVNAVLAKELPGEICSLLVKKGLSFAQAEAMLERAKDLLREAII